jgi:hypothetical protein
MGVSRDEAAEMGFRIEQGGVELIDRLHDRVGATRSMSMDRRLLQAGNEFRPLMMRAEGWFQCEGCGHNAMPLDPEFRCTCGNCEQTEPILP